MKWLALLGMVAALVAPGTTNSPQQNVRKIDEYHIRVTSSVPGQEVEFEGAYLFNGTDAELHTVRQMTPFDLRANGQLGMGVFRKTKGDPQLVVEVWSFKDGKPENSSRTQDDGVIFGQNLVENVTSFTHSFTWPRR